MSSLPSSLALAQLHGRWDDASVLRALCAAICAAGAVQYAPDAVPQTWRSLGRETKDRLSLDFDHSWAIRQFSPLERGEPARVMRLRGYGNAIVPQAAAEAIAIARDTMIATGIWAALCREYAA